MRWYQIWIKSLLNPTVRSFQKIGSLSNRRKSYDWFFTGSLVLALCTVSLIYPPQEICGRVIIVSFLLTFMLIIYVVLLNATAKVLGGIGDYEEYVFTVSAFLAPLEIVAGIFYLILGQLYFLIPIVLYGFYLCVVSTKAIHKVSVTKAFLINLFISVSLLTLIIAEAQLYLTFMKDIN